MIISHQHKFIFFCNGKTGTTSIEKALEVYQEGEEFNIEIKGIYPTRHIPPVIIKAILPNNIWNSYFKFTFVRNPWDWFVSSWKYSCSVRLKKLSFLYAIQHPRGATQVFQDYSYRKLMKMSRQKVFDKEDIDFYYDFLKNRFGIPPYSGRHQHHYIFDIDGNKIVDFVGRFEQLENDFNTIKKKLDLDINLLYLNRTNWTDYRDYYTEDSKQRVAELWKQDIDLFGYTFD